jgi:hypothetical protein
MPTRGGDTVNWQSTRLDQVLSWTRVDLRPEHRQPSTVMVVVATVASLAGSLAADAALVSIGTTIFPSTKGFVHFQFSDYAKLTVIGVVLACIGWPVLTRISFDPRWVYLRSAVLVTVVLLVPDLWILLHGEPGRAVGVLACMHVAIALVTYNCVVRIAPVRQASGAARPGA